MDRLKEIKARLKDITPSPWTVNAQGNYIDVQTERDKRLEQRRGWRHYLLEIQLHFDFRPKEYRQAKQDAEFVAHAPEDVEWLINQVEYLRQQVKNVIEETRTVQVTCPKCTAMFDTQV
jgi:hypothetical protein